MLSRTSTGTWGDVAGLARGSQERDGDGGAGLPSRTQLGPQLPRDVWVKHSRDPEPTGAARAARGHWR